MRAWINRFISTKNMLALGCIAAGWLNPISAAAQKSEIPFVLQDNLIRVHVVINGERAVGVLDSGTGAFALDRSFALHMGLRPGPENGKVPGGGQAVPMFPVQLERVEFGPERLSRLAGVALDLRELSSSAGFAIEALLGEPVFLRQPISISYPTRRIVFWPVEKEVQCADPIPFELMGGVPVVSVAIRATTRSAPRMLHLVVDLGTRHHAVILGSKFLDTEDGQQLAKMGRQTQVGTGTGGAVMGTISMLHDLVIGPQEFSNIDVALTRQVGAFSTGAIEGSLGVPFWQAGTITFDYPHHFVCIDLPKQ